MRTVGEDKNLKDNLYHLGRLALTGSSSSTRMYLAKLSRQLRKEDPKFAKSLEELLKTKPARSNDILRDSSNAERFEFTENGAEDSGSVIKIVSPDSNMQAPIWPSAVANKLNQLVKERMSASTLNKKELLPVHSAIFEGPPGVGKTLSAKWLANILGLPLYVLDLTTVMSSYLGRSGYNLRRAIDYAKSHPCVFLLDEFDAIAKSRGDSGDVGELKRIVTIMLQELESWNNDSLLIAATNHSELVDSALWRRFDLRITFPYPDKDEVRESINRFLGDDFEALSDWVGVLEKVSEGKSFSDIERIVLQLRRLAATNEQDQFEEFAADLLFSNEKDLNSSLRYEIAVHLVAKLGYSQHKASRLTGVSRDTIRKRLS